MNKTIDNHQLKITIGVACIVIIFIIITSVQMATWKTKIELNQEKHTAIDEYIQNQINAQEADLELLKLKADSRDIQLATINTKLANIESMLIEVKADLKKLQ